MRFCGGCGAPLGAEPSSPISPEAGDAAQLRYVTALFCDLVGSTPLAERLDPEEWRDVLSAYQHACVRAVERVGGFMARYVGDGVVAYFGYPRAHEDDAQRAVHAALGILDELAELNAALRKSSDVILRVRIGLHTGMVVAGQMGAGESSSMHEIVGEMPHIAARLEANAEPDSVVISDATQALVEGYFETESLGAQSLKGVSRPIGAHRVLRPTGAVSRLEVAGGRPLTPVVGRDGELSILEHAWEQATEGSGQVVQISGEAGIGKSRLVRTLVEHLGEQIGSEEVWQCSAHHETTALYPVIRYLERRLRLDRRQPPKHQRAVLEGATRDAGLDPAESVPLLADLLSIDCVAEAERPDLAPRDARSATLRVLESILIGDRARRPVLFAVEDLHWADPTTVELLDRIITGLRGVAALCVLTFRREFSPPWTDRREIIAIELGPLSSDEVREMVAAVDHIEPDSRVLAWVDAAADGVPLFVEEMLKTLAVTEARSKAIANPAVPPTLEGLLTERLDRLPDLGDVIDVASVIGREFERELLEALAPLGAADLDPALSLLTAQGVLRPVAGAGSRFEFTHTLLQEAAYARLLRRRRQALHGLIADTLSTRFPGVAEREPEVVAAHWSAAAEPDRAVAFWRAAGVRALDRAAFQEAAEHFRRGLEALDEKTPEPADDLDRADFQTYRAASLQAARGYAAAGVDEAYAAARSVYERGRHEERLIAVIRGEWMFYLLRGQYGTALEIGREMLDLGERDGDSFRRAEGQLYTGLVHMYLADFERARKHLDESFELYRKPERHDQIYDAQGDTGVGALAYNAVVLWNLGHVSESHDRSDHSLLLAEQVGGQVTRAQAWGMRAMLHLSRAERSEFGHWVDKTRRHSREHNVGYWVAVSSLFSGWLQGRAGELEPGTKRLEQSLDAYRASGSRLSLPLFYVLLADLRLMAGDRPRALEVLRAGEEYVAETGERFTESELYRFTGRALMSGESPDPDGATAAFEHAVACAREQNARLLELRAATHLAVHQRAIGASPTALETLESLCDWFASASELPDVVRARGLLVPEASGR
jgi:class 3 adenylate cyclase/tetratricopeptide (TPR) repeat protein